MVLVRGSFVFLGVAKDPLTEWPAGDLQCTAAGGREQGKGGKERQGQEQVKWCCVQRKLHPTVYVEIIIEDIFLLSCSASDT